MRATHYRHWVPLTEFQVWEVMEPPEPTAEERAIAREHGRVALVRFLGPAFIIFVLLCIATTDNVIWDSAVHCVYAFTDTMNPLVSAYLAEPLQTVVSAVTSAVQTLSPVQQFLSGAISLGVATCCDIWQALKPVFSAISTFVGNWSPQVLKELREHVVTV